MLNITAEEKKALKGRGYIITRDGEHFIARIITVDGVLNDEEMAVIAEAAKKFGDGRVAMTSRLTVEVQGLTYENIEPFNEFIAKAGLYTGGTGSRVRPIVPCKGSVCVHGLIDTQELARELHETFYKGWYDVKLPHKFKIGVGGCPNNCVKPDLNDLGIVGQRIPGFKADLCRGCKVCQVENACPVKAAKVVDGVLTINKDVCNNCGRCAGKCPFGALETGETLYKVYVGGRWGKKVRMGSPLQKLFTREEVLNVVEKAILLFKSKGESGERFGQTVDRLGVEKVEKMLIADNLLKRKEEILEMETIGGAKC